MRKCASTAEFEIFGSLKKFGILMKVEKALHWMKLIENHINFCLRTGGDEK